MALLHVDPYNDFITDGGKLWEGHGDHPSPTQRATSAAKLFTAGEWRGQFRDEFAAGDDDVLISEHWA